EPDQQRGAFGEPRINTPRATAPRAARRLTYLLRVARGVEAIPRDVGLGIPAKALGLAVELAQRGYLGRELQREPPLDEALLLRLVGAQQSRRVLARVAHPSSEIAPCVGSRRRSAHCIPPYLMERGTGVMAVDLPGTRSYARPPCSFRNGPGTEGGPHATGDPPLPWRDAPRRGAAPGGGGRGAAPGGGGRGR